MLVKTIKTANPMQAAIAFSAVLAVDKGVQSKVELRGTSALVIADDGKIVKFSKPRRRSAMDIAAEACGLVKVRGAVSGKIYYE